MVYLLASLRMFVYCTVYGDGIHFRRPPAHPPTTMVTSFPLCICYLPSVTVNFSSLALLTAPPLSLLPPPLPFFLESLIRSWIWQACGFLQRRCMWLWQKTFTQKLHEHNTHTHTLAYTSTNLTSFQTHGSHAVVWMQKKKKNMGINWRKNVWIGLTFIFMYLCIFLPHFGLGWYLVVQYCITPLTKGKSAALSFNENNVT